MIKLSIKKISTMMQCEIYIKHNPLLDILHLVVDTVTIDSRELSKKADKLHLFVAIRGAVYDAHDFIEISATNGAKGFIVERLPEDINSNAIYKNIAFLLVKDSILALGELARSYRLLFDIPVIAITGSNGKTTLKEMLFNIAKYEYGAKYVLATFGNLNNHIGVPLTIFNLTYEHKILILELGMNHMEELNYLSHIVKPTIAIINNVMRAHAEFFNSIEEIAQAKSEIFDGLLPLSVACVDSSSPFKQLFLDKLYNNHPLVKVVMYDSTDLNILNFYHIKLQVLGIHNKYNAISAIAIAKILALNNFSIQNGLNAFNSYNRRLQLKTAFNNSTIIDDSYNANPDSVKAAINAALELNMPIWFIFGELAELGKDAILWHKEIGAYASSCSQIIALITLGQLANLSGIEYVNNRKNNVSEVSLHQNFSDIDSLIAYCKNNLPANIVVLVKGSRSNKLDLLVDNIVKDNNDKFAGLKPAK